MKKNLFILFVSFCGLLTSQIGINTKNPDPSASLEVNSDQGKKGFLLPRVTTEQRNAIQNPAAGLQVFNTTTECTETFTGSKGWYNICNFTYNKPDGSGQEQNPPPYNGVGYYFNSEITSKSEHHSAFIYNNKVYTWGKNDYGQLGNNSFVDSITPLEVKGLLSGQIITQVVAGAASTLALTSDGKLYSWGSNFDGTLGLSSAYGPYDYSTPMLVKMDGELTGKTVTKISANHYGYLVLTSDGKLYTWGYNRDGRLGIGNSNPINYPTTVYMNGVLAGKIITKISSGGANLVLSSDGKVYSWGDNTKGSLGCGCQSTPYIPVAIKMDGVLAGKTITKISSGSSYHSLVLASDGKLYTWGENSNGQLGENSYVNSNVPIGVDMGTLAGKTITKISAGHDYNLVLTSDGKIYSWGRNNFGQLGNNSNIDYNYPIAVDMSGILAGKTIVDIYTKYDSSYALDANGNLYAWGKNDFGQLGDGTTINTKVPVLVNKSL